MTGFCECSARIWDRRFSEVVYFCKLNFSVRFLRITIYVLVEFAVSNEVYYYLTKYTIHSLDSYANRPYRTLVRCSYSLILSHNKIQKTVDVDRITELLVSRHSAVMTASEGKPKRLRPWLEGLLNRGDISSLQWIDEDKTTFRITWKHFGKQDWSPEDGRVFMVSVYKN